MSEDRLPDCTPESPEAMADHAPSSNRRRKKALRDKRRRRAERRAQEPPRDEAAEADAKLRATRRGMRNHLEAIRRMAGGESFDPPRQSYLSLVQEILRAARWRDVETPALALVHACLGTKLLADNPGPDRVRIRNAFVHLALRHRAWIRRPHDWRSKRRNRTRQLAELVRHLVGTYPVPRFFDEAWTLPIEGEAARKAWRFQDWFLHIAGGQNLRSAPNLPCTLTKREAHHTLEADAELGIGQALRFGQARAISLSGRVAEAFVATRAGDVVEAPGGEADNAFWVSVLRFLAPHAMLDPGCIGPVLDYLIDQRYVPVRQRDGTVRPARPNLSMKGRTLEGLLDQTAAWHRAVTKVARARGRQWPSIGVLTPAHAEPGAPGTFTWRTGSRQKPTVWTVTELLTSKELAQEGRALGHCVYSYAWSCERGGSSIWSLRRERDGLEERRVTIEIHPQSRTIVQVRGARNRPPKPAERAALERFAAAARLAYAPGDPRGFP